MSFDDCIISLGPSVEGLRFGICTILVNRSRWPGAERWEAPVDRRYAHGLMKNFRQLLMDEKYSEAFATPRMGYENTRGVYAVFRRVEHVAGCVLWQMDRPLEVMVRRPDVITLLLPGISQEADEAAIAVVDGYRTWGVGEALSYIRQLKHPGAYSIHMRPETREDIGFCSAEWGIVDAFWGALGGRYEGKPPGF